MFKKISVIFVVIVLSLVGNQAYQHYARYKFQRDFSQKYFGPHPIHPVFGTIKGFGSGWEFYTSLPTPGLNGSRVQFIIDENPNATNVQNYQLLRAKWPMVWPPIFEALKKIVIDYGNGDALSSATPKLSVSIPSEHFTDKTAWSVNLEFEPSAGIYDVQMRGWTEITDSGATF